MDDRQNQLLKTIIEAYIETAEPIGSKFLAEASIFSLLPYHHFQRVIPDCQFPNKDVQVWQPTGFYLVYYSFTKLWGYITSVGHKRAPGICLYTTCHSFLQG